MGIIKHILDCKNRVLQVGGIAEAVLLSESDYEELKEDFKQSMKDVPMDNKAETVAELEIFTTANLLFRGAVVGTKEYIRDAARILNN